MFGHADEVINTGGDKVQPERGAGSD